MCGGQGWGEGYPRWPDGKELPANKGDAEDAGSIPESGRSPGEGNGYHPRMLAWEVPWTEEPNRLLFMGSQRIEHD